MDRLINLQDFDHNESTFYNHMIFISFVFVGRHVFAPQYGASLE
ncbi:MAG: hypothetical protein RL180_1699 [Pseudomonadota bacterium]|jgi:hypothetical protein